MVLVKMLESFLNPYFILFKFLISSPNCEPKGQVFNKTAKAKQY